MHKKNNIKSLFIVFFKLTLNFISWISEMKAKQKPYLYLDARKTIINEHLSFIDGCLVGI